MDLSFSNVLLNIFVLFGFCYIVYLITNKLDTVVSITILGLLVHFIFVYISFFPI